MSRAAGALIVLLAAGSAFAADREAGRAQAAGVCAVCHGPVGLAMQPNVPNLAGQPAIYLADQLRQYRGGRRQHEVMSIVARPLTDAEIENLAEWYASLQVRVEPQ